MNTVGPDKRTQYYRLSSDAVLKALRSHSLGLTNSEAARRQTTQGANVLPASRISDSFLLLQAAGHPFVAVTALAAALASTISQTGLALLLAGLLTAHLALRFRRLQARLNQVTLATLPSSYVKVTRNDQTRSLEAAMLVVGDIVHVEAGEMVPADLRILQEHDLVANDSLLFGGNIQTRKFSHTVNQAVPLIARNNQLWAGSSIVQGTGQGVVIAIGVQTELGRITVLHRTAQLNKLTQEMRDPSRYLFSVLVAAGLLALILLGWQSASSAADILLALLLFAVSVVPNGVELTRWLLPVYAARGIAKGHSTNVQAATLATLGDTDVAIIDTTDAAKNIVVAAAVTIGRTTYMTEDTGYEPIGKVFDENGKTLTRKQLANLELLFEACALVNSAAVLRPDTHHKEWHARGNLYEVAALVLARKAGLNTERLQTSHELLHTFPYDAGRQLASTIRSYGDDTVVFVRGNPTAVLERSRKLWDHGHVRALSTSDTSFFTKVTPALKGKAYMAFAYRLLPSKTDQLALDMNAIEQDLTFLGIVEMQHASTMDGVVAAAQAAGIHTITLSADAHIGSINGASLRKLSDAQLVMLLEENCSFNRLTAEDVLRLVTTMQSTKHDVLVVGNSLTVLPARVQAQAGLTLTGFRPEVDGIRDASDLSDLMKAARKLPSKLENIRHLAVIQSTAMAVVALLSAVGLFYYRVPLAVSINTVVVLQLLVFPLAAFALPSAKSHFVARREFIAAGCVAGMLACGSFLYSFTVHGVSPSFISPDSRFTFMATTSAASALGLLLLVEVLVAYYQTKTALTARSWVYLCSAALVVIGILYSPWLQQLPDTAILLPANWLALCVTGLLYTGFRLFQHHTRHHTREAVLQLHREIRSQRG